MADEELAQLQQGLAACKDRIPDYEDLRNFLRLSREARIKNAEDVAKYGSLLLKHHMSKLAEEEKWLLHEQVAVAALECNARSSAAGLIRAVLNNFPDSVRARRLQGMFYEAAGLLDRAEEVYTATLRETPSNETMAKRMVALCISRGQVDRAIESLTAYLDHYSNDREAWEQLADLYIKGGLYRQAAFCYEELLSMAPTNPGSHLRYADVLYTLGGSAALKTARAYYSKAVQLSAGRSSRALFGVLACSAALAQEKDTGSTTDTQELQAAAAQQLLALYRQQAPDKVAAVEEQLRRMGAL